MMMLGVALEILEIQLKKQMIRRRVFLGHVRIHLKLNQSKQLEILNLAALLPKEAAVVEDPEVPDVNYYLMTFWLKLV